MVPQQNQGVIVAVVVVIFLAFLLFAQFLYWSTQDQKEKESRELSRRLGTLADKAQSPLFRLQRAAESGGISAKLDIMLRQAGSPYTMGTLFGRIAIAAVVGALVGAVLTRSLAGFVLVFLPPLLYAAAIARHTDATRGTRARKRPPPSAPAAGFTRPCSVTATRSPR